MTHKEENELIVEAVRWASRTCSAISQAGGDPKYILRNMPADLIVTFVRNNLEIKYSKDY